MIPENVRGIILKMTNGGVIYAPFLYYNEDATENMCIDCLKQYDRVEIESIDEYSIGVARAALPHDSLPCNAGKRHDGPGNRSGRLLLYQLVSGFPRRYICKSHERSYGRSRNALGFHRACRVGSQNLMKENRI